MKLPGALWNHIHVANSFYKKKIPLILIAVADKKIVGSISLIPSPIQEYRNNSLNPYNSLLVCKAMVHPDYQRKGIFGSLLKKSKELAESEGYDTLITFSNNPFSFQGFQRSGFHDVASMRWLKTYLSMDATVSKHVAPLRLPRIAKKIMVSLCTCVYSLATPLIQHPYQLKYGVISEFIEQISEFSNSDYIKWWDILYTVERFYPVEVLSGRYKLQMPESYGKWKDGGLCDPSV